MKKFLPILAFSFLFVACDEMKGNISIREELSLKAKKTGLFQSGTKDIKIPTGYHEATLKPTSKTSMNLEIKVGDKERKIPFNVPAGTVIPEYDGQFEILGRDSGQNYDLLADVKSDVSSYDYDATESCIAGYIPVRRCVTHPGTSHCQLSPGRSDCHIDRRGHRVCRQSPPIQQCYTRPSYTDCRMVDEAVYGMQNLVKRKTTTVKHLVIDVMDAGNQVAQFNHSSSKSYTSTVDSSPCYQ